MGDEISCCRLLLYRCRLGYMCGDFVYVLLFPQLVSVMFVPWFNTFGSLTG